MNRNVRVLLVEDSIADATLIQEIFIEEKVKVDLSVVRDGFEALDYLQARNKYAGVIRPDLVILDLNMPKKDGRELLHEMKQIPHLKSIPVIILTTSKAEEDIMQSYNLQASCYLIKPIELARFSQLVKYIENFWFASVQYPTPYAQ